MLKIVIFSSFFNDFKHLLKYFLINLNALKMLFILVKTN